MTYMERTRKNLQRAKNEGLCHYCYTKLDGTGTRTLCAPCAAKNRERANATRNRVKDACFAAYGGYRCACCGETEKSFLHLDHKDGGGNKQRMEQFGSVTPGSGRLYRWLAKMGFPAGYQILCANCNQGEIRTGICPHEQKPQHPIDAMLSHYKNEGIVN